MCLTPHFHCREHRFHPWRANQAPANQKKKKKKEVVREYISGPMSCWMSLCADTLLLDLLRNSLPLMAQRLKRLPRHAGDLGLIPGSRRNWQPTPVFSPGEFHGRRSLVGYQIALLCKWNWYSVVGQLHLNWMKTVEKYQLPLVR